MVYGGGGIGYGFELVGGVILGRSVVGQGVVLENDPKWFRLGLGKGSDGLFQGLSLGQLGLGSRLGG